MVPKGYKSKNIPRVLRKKIEMENKAETYYNSYQDKRLRTNECLRNGKGIRILCNYLNQSTRGPRSPGFKS